MRSWIAGLLALCILPLSLSAKDKHTDFQYAQLYQVLQQGQHDDPDGAFDTSLILTSAKGRRLAADTTAELLDGAQVQPLTVGERLALELPVDPALAERNAIVRIYQPDVAFSLQSSIHVPAGTDLTYWDLAKAAPAQERQMDKFFGGLFGSGVIPAKSRVEVINLKFARSARQTLELSFADGSKQTFNERGGMIALPWNPDWRDARAHLSEAIQGIALEMRQTPLHDSGRRPR